MLRALRALRALRVPVVSFVFLGAVGLVAAARADEPGVRMQADAGMGSIVRGGMWSPVTVELENPGAAINGRVVVHYADVGLARGTAAEPVELPTGAKKQVVLYARPRGGPQQLEVSVEDARGRVRAGPLQIPINAVEDRTAIVALVSMGAHGDPGMRALITADTRVVALDADQLPERWPALAALDSLVLRDPDVAKLGPARVEAIKEWVAAGGSLVVTSAEKWRTMDDPAFTELLPVRVTGVRTSAGAELPFPFSEHAGDIAVAVTEPLRGSVLVGGPDGAPFAAQARYGLGRVVFLAADPGALPDVDAVAKADLWAGLLALPPELPDTNTANYYSGAQSAESFISQELSRIPPLKPPSVLLVTMLIGLYVLVVGPGDYFLLKRMKKLHWTWATYPAAIAVFSGLIYAYARFSRSSDMMIRTLTLVDAPAEPPTAPSPVHVFGGVYSPRAGRFEVAVALANAVSGGFAEDNSYMGSTSSSEYLTVGGKHPMLGLSIPIWSMAGVELMSASTEPAPFLVEKEGAGWKITNTGEGPLEYVGLLTDGKVVDGGRLENGKAVTLSRTMAGHRLSELTNEMSQTMFGDAHSKEDLSRIVRVFAWATDPPLADAATDAYYSPQQTRRGGRLERPRTDRKKPMIFAVARDSTLPISVRGEITAGSGLTIWRRPLADAGTYGKNP